MWPEVVTGVATGVLSGTLGTFATISHQRSAEQRARMLDAADDFIGAATKASSELRVVEQVTRQGVVKNYALAVEAVLAHIPRLLLLYGRESETAKLANDIHGHLAVITDHVVSSAAGGAYPVGDVREHHHQALRDLDDFTAAAAAHVKRTSVRLFGLIL
jgi:hypothetical protein